MKQLITLLSTFLSFYMFSQNIIRADQIIIGKDCRITQMKTDMDNNYYVTGYMHGTANFNPAGNAMEVKSDQSRDIFIAKYNTSNELVWINQIRQKTKFANTWAFLDIDEDGNVIVGGSFEKGLLIDNGASQRITTFGREDIYLLKMNPNGKTIWWKHIGGANMDIVSSVATDSQNNIFISGQFTGPVDFDPSSSEAIRTAQFKNTFLAKYSPKGRFQWVKQIQEKELKHQNAAPIIYINKQDQIYLAAQFNNRPFFKLDSAKHKSVSYHGTANLYVLNYTTKGQLRWAQSLAIDGMAKDSRITGINCNNQGNVYLTGYISIARSKDTIHNSFASSFKGNGENLWNNVIVSPSHNYTNGICINQQNDVVIAGGFNGFFDLENGQQMISKDNDAMIIKLDQSGKISTALQISGEGSQGFESIAPLNNGKLLALGSFSLYTDIKSRRKLRAYKDAKTGISPVTVVVD